MIATGNTVRVYSYGCRAPTEGGDELVRQLRLAHLLYNDRIAVERDRRRAYNDRCNRQSPELAESTLMIEAYEATLTDAWSCAGDERVRARRRTGASDETRAAVDDAKGILSGLRERRSSLIALERRRSEGFRRDLAAMDCASHEAGLVATRRRVAEGLYWMTRGAIDASIEQARKSHRPPHFREGVGVAGLVAVSLKHGCTVSDVFGDNQFLRLDPIHEDAYDGTRGERRRAVRTMARMRVGSTGTGNTIPVWVILPVVLHRQLPPNGRVLGAKIVVRQEATRLDYSLQITVEEPAATVRPVAPKTAIGIDLGWRWQDAVRVAYTVDGRGRHGPVSLANDVAGAIEHANSTIRAIRGKNFDAAVTDLADWIAAHEVPEWLRVASVGLRQWRRPGKLAAVLVGHRALADLPVVPGWRDRRFRGDDGIVSALEAWRRQDAHLWTWEHHERRKALARRLEAYRIWAAGIARDHSLVCLEDFDLRAMARKPTMEQEGEYDDLARAQRIVSAPSLLRGAVINACASRGTRLVKVPCEGTTITCHACHAETRWDAAKYLSHRCECGAVWDQDYNAAVNILRTGLDQAQHETVEEAAPRIGRWQKRRAEAESKAAEAESKAGTVPADPVRSPAQMPAERDGSLDDGIHDAIG